MRLSDNEIKPLGRGLGPGIAGLAMLLWLPSMAFGATTTTSPTIMVNVPAACQVSTQNLDFGTYDSLAAAGVSATTQINVNCSKGTPFTVALDAGQHASTAFNRNMANGTHLLAYQLYTNSTHSTVWGDGTNGTSTVSGTGTGPGAAHTIKEVVYGELPPLQPVPAGNYSDVITVSVGF